MGGSTTLPLLLIPSWVLAIDPFLQKLAAWPIENSVSSPLQRVFSHCESHLCPKLSTPSSNMLLRVKGSPSTAQSYRTILQGPIAILQGLTYNLCLPYRVLMNIPLWIIIHFLIHALIFWYWRLDIWC